MRYLFVFLFSCLLTVPSRLNAQMKNYCDSAGAKLVSTIKQSPGTLRMIKTLDSINTHASPVDFYLMNSARAAMLVQKLGSTKDPFERLNLYLQYANESMNAGYPAVAISVLKQIITGMGMKAQSIKKDYKIFFDLLALCYMRMGELENLAINHNPESFLLPIQGGGIHKLRAGSDSAIGLYTNILLNFPDDLESRYMLNLAYMNLGNYPDSVPQQWLLEPALFKKNTSPLVFKDVAAKKNVDMNGLSGGCIVEDMDNDGLPDIIASSHGLADQIRYMHQEKDGTFKIVTASSGLAGLTGGLNLIHTDYNNDGFADFLILRGGGLGKNAKFPFSLIRNNGNNTFDDVTLESGLYSPFPTQTACWGDFNNDGWIDLFVPHENYPCQLFINEKGKFREVAAKYGLNLTCLAKGCTWGDINNDGYPDLFLSIFDAPNKLWLNVPGAKPGERAFKEISKTAGVQEPIYSFPTWFFDFDNDGWLDLYVSGYDPKRFKIAGEDAAREMLNMPALAELPRLYHNNGNNTFTEVSAAYGVNHVAYAMGGNFGDIDNDGWLDYYLGTGAPELNAIVPNRLYHNLGGKKFEDITYATNTGHIRKGYGVAFADIDNDGDQDIYEVIGGAYEGDQYPNVLFENNGPNKNHWIKIKLTGVTANRLAIGARVKIRVKMADGTMQDFYHTVSTGGSFGSKPLMIEAGLGNAASIESITIKWPNAKQTVETITSLELDSLVRIKEGVGKE